jgi:hypothetical protein
MSTMKKTMSALAILLFTSVLFSQTASAPVPLGTWNYGVFVGKNRIGSAASVVSFSSGQYVSTMDMTIKIAEAIVMTSETAKESQTFAPISYSSSTSSVLKDTVTRDIISAEFSGGKITLKRAGETKQYEFKEPFVISGNILIAGLLKGKLANNLEMKGMTYSPGYEEESLIPVSEKVIGKESVTLPSGKKDLIHTVQTMGPIRNIHNYMDSKGNVYKTSISMLNMTLDLILESYQEGKPGK